MAEEYTRKSCLEKFISSESFDETHMSVRMLMKYIESFSEDDMLRIMFASQANSQINWIIADPDVDEFLSSVVKRIDEKKLDEDSKDIYFRVKKDLDTAL